MKMKLLAGVALTAAMAASGAFAQDRGFYVGVDAGYHWPEGIQAESSSRSPSFDFDFNSEDDFAGFAKLGYRINPNWRVELEGGYRPGDIESVRAEASNAPIRGLCAPGVTRTAASPACGSPNGEIESYTLMANVIYDFDFRFFGPRLVPFVGAGIGVNRVSVDTLGQFSNVGAVTAANPQFQNLNIDDEDTAFAFQGLAGFAFQATDRLALDLTYRYLGGSDLNFEGRGSAPNGLQPGEFSGEYEDQSVTFGLRYQFGSPPPPPPPADVPPPPPPPADVPPPPPPPAAVAQEFIVYFPFDQYVLTPEAQTVVQQAAQYAAQGGAANIVVVGHADTSGSAAYNVRLSERRAKAVADALVGLGVPQTGLSVDWRGESQPAVPTPDGTKEPLNRRTTITVNPGAGDPAMGQPAPAPTQQ